MRPIRYTCPCGDEAVLREASEVVSPAATGLVWYCESSGKWARVHKGSPSHKIDGTFADRETHLARREVKVVLNALIAAASEIDARLGRHKEGAPRVRAYAWLASSLGIELGDCDIARFELADCKNAMALFRSSTPSFMRPL